MFRMGKAVTVAISLCLSVLACSSSSSPGSSPDAAVPTDAATSSDGDATTKDARDAGAFVFSFGLTLSGKKVTFDRGQFGLDGADLYLELYDGGDAACPTQDSPTPKHTLIVSGLKKGGTSTPTVTLLDFVGDVITTPKPSRAASAASAAMRIASDSRVELDLSATFDADGTGAGQVVAEHCTSLDAK